MYREPHPDPQCDAHERAKRDLEQLQIPEAEKVLRAKAKRSRLNEVRQPWSVRLLNYQTGLEMESVVGLALDETRETFFVMMIVAICVGSAGLVELGFGGLAIVGILGMVGVIGGLLLWAYPSHLLAKEERWRRALPFSVSGYWEALGYQKEGPNRSLSLRVSLSPKAESPDLLLLAKPMSLIGAKVTLDAAERCLLVKSPELPSGVTRDYNSDGPFTLNEPGNRQVRKWLRLLLTRVLPEVAKVYPISSVEIVDD